MTLIFVEECMIVNSIKSLIRFKIYMTMTHTDCNKLKPFLKLDFSHLV